jgi:hypothetical protein
MQRDSECCFLLGLFLLTLAPLLAGDHDFTAAALSGLSHKRSGDLTSALPLSLRPSGKAAVLATCPDEGNADVDHSRGSDRIHERKRQQVVNADMCLRMQLS